jgi:hypothetical protein
MLRKFERCLKDIQRISEMLILPFVLLYSMQKMITTEEYEIMMRKLESKNIVSLSSIERNSNFDQESDRISKKISITLNNKKMMIIPLVNSINKQSSFNANQIEFIKAYGGKYDNKTEYWYLEVL